MLRCCCICISSSLLFLSGCATRSTNISYDSSTTVSTSADGFYIPVDNSDTPSSHDIHAKKVSHQNEAIEQEELQDELVNTPDLLQSW